MNVKELYNKIEKLEVVENYDKELKEEILKELRTEIITGGKINTGIKRAFNNMKKMNDKRPLFQKIHRTENDTFVFLDGFKLIEWKNLDSVPKQLREEIENKVDDSFTLNYNKCKNQEETETGTINLTDVKKVINYQKIQDKNEFPQVYILENKIWLNPNFIIDILALAENKENEIKVEYSREIAPINIELENCNVLVLPIRPQESIFDEITNNFKKIIEEN